MNLIIAGIAAVGLLFGGILFVGNYQLSGKVDQLTTELATAQSDLNRLNESEEDERQDRDLKTLENRLTSIEVAKSTASAAAPAEAEPVDLSGVEAKLLAHDKDIAQLKKDASGSRQLTSRADELANRFLGGSGDENDGERESGLNRLSELRTLFSGDAGELTEEQQQRRAELTQQFQGQRDDWTIRGFDRTLELKLEDDQKDTLKQYLAQERTSLDELKGQDLEKEALEASQKQVKANTDARIETILTADQNTSWGKYRSRSRSSRSFGRSSRGRSSRERSSERESE